MSQFGNLLAPPTKLPVDPAVAGLDGGTPAVEVAAQYPASCAAWATLAEDALRRGATIEAYAYARTGYHRGLDALRTAEVLGLGENGRYLLAATFGNVHGVYKPGNVKLRPDILKELQDAVGEKVGKLRPFELVFHGGSGSTLDEIREAVSYGVVKMNVDTDTQYAFTREIAGHMFTNYDGVLKVDGEVGNKKAYDPRSYLKLAEQGMAHRVVEACEALQSAGTSATGS